MSTILHHGALPYVQPVSRLEDETLLEIIAGLEHTPKRLPSKLFYDDRGAELFNQICTLPEYYPTRAEISILERRAVEIGVRLGEGCRVVELGSGSGTKTRILLRNLVAPAEYIPVDIAGSELKAFARELKTEFPALRVRPIEADFTRELPLRQLTAGTGPTVVFFPGSTIGNFEPPAAAELLRRVTEACGPNTHALVGVDLPKRPETLVHAYNDAAGVTAAFNLNLLAHINRAWAADFDLRAFRHDAPFNSVESRIEMHLVSGRDQVVHLAGRRFVIARGERLVTEYSYKHSLTAFNRIARQAGLHVERVWTDDAGQFSVQLLSPR